MSIFPVYLYLGPENGRKKEALQELQEQITKANGEPPEKHRLYAFESDSEAILTLVQNGSLFAAHTLVIVNNAEALNKKADVTSLVNYIKKPQPKRYPGPPFRRKQDRNQDPKRRPKIRRPGLLGDV
jgi:DNA polymerase III delta subunit